MAILKTVFDPAQRERLLARIDRLEAGSPRQWGRMTPHQAVCHLSDALRATLGERTGPARRETMQRRVVRFVAFTLPFRWPHGVRTAPELDQQRDGTPPVDFERDRAELKALLERVAATDGAGLRPHHLWGPMRPGEVGRYAYRHADHHLRQFGL